MQRRVEMILRASADKECRVAGWKAQCHVLFDSGDHCAQIVGQPGLAAPQFVQKFSIGKTKWHCARVRAPRGVNTTNAECRDREKYAALGWKACSTFTA
jgi:hypothetical protein